MDAAVPFFRKFFGKRFFRRVPVRRFVNNILLLVASFFCLVGPAFAGSKVVVLQSSRLIPYEQARLGFDRILTGRIPSRGAKSIQPTDLSLFILSEEDDLQLLRHTIEVEHPEVLVAIGAKALAFATVLKTDRPIVYLLVPNPKPIVKGRKNVTGVEMTIPPARQLAGLIAVLPDAKRVGTIYGPRNSSRFIAKAQAAAARLGIELLAEKARSPKQVPELLANLRGKIDSFWILPDLTVLTPQTLEKILLFSLIEKAPVLSFSEKYLEEGAAVAVTFDLAAMGKKAGELTWKILQGGNVNTLPPVSSDKIKIEVNDKVLDKLGRDYNPEAFAAGSLKEK
jgi:putative ABC transport system substrate-binding protein